MSSALAAIKKRKTEPPKPEQHIQPQTIAPNTPVDKPKTGMELLQSLEKRVTEIETAHTFSSIVEEYELRFKMIAEEIANMKDLLIKLQTFSMDLNTSLFEFVKNTNNTSSVANKEVETSTSTSTSTSTNTDDDIIDDDSEEETINIMEN
jgi:hypothetical protein